MPNDGSGFISGSRPGTGGTVTAPPPSTPTSPVAPYTPTTPPPSTGGGDGSGFISGGRPGAGGPVVVPAEVQPPPPTEVPADGLTPFGDMFVTQQPARDGGGIIQGPVLTDEERVDAYNRESQDALDDWMDSTQDSLSRLDENSQTVLERNQWNDIAKFMVMMSMTEELNPDAPDELLEGIVSVNSGLMEDYGDSLKDHLENLETGWWDANYVEPEHKNIFQRRLGEYKEEVGRVAQQPILSHILKGMNWTSQKTLVRLDEMRVKANQSNFDFYSYMREEAAKDGDEDRYASITQTLLDMQDDPRYLVRAEPGEDGNINFLEAYMGKDPDWGGWKGQVLNVFGTAIFDPVSYVGLGPLSRAAAVKASIRIGAAADGAAEAGIALSRRIGAVGTKGLTAAETANMVRWSQFGSENISSALRSSRFFARTPEVAHAQQMRHLARSGQSGIRVAGKTVIPTNPQGLAQSSLVQKVIPRIAGERGAQLAAAATRGGRWADEVFRSTSVTTSVPRRTAQVVQADAERAAAEAGIAARAAAASDANVAATAAENLAAARRAATIVDPTDLRTTATGMPMPSGTPGNRFARPSVVAREGMEAEEAYTAALKLNTTNAASTAQADSAAADFAAARSTAVPNNPVLGDPSTLTGFNMPEQVASGTAPKRFARSGNLGRQTEEAYQVARKANEAEALRVLKTDPPPVVLDALDDIDDALATVDVLIRTKVKAGLLNHIKDNKVVNTVRKGLVPRERLLNPALRSADVGPQVLGSAVSRSKGLREMRLSDATRGLTESAVKAATKEWDSWDELNKFLNQAMSSMEKYEAAIVRLEQLGPDKAKTLRLLEDMGQADDGIRASVIRSGTDLSELRDLRNYIPRILGPELKQDIKLYMAEQADDIVRAEKARAFAGLGIDVKIEDGVWQVVDDAATSREVFDMTAQKGALNRRNLDASVQDLYEVNDAQRAALQHDVDGLPNPLADFDADMFSNDVVAAISFRAHAAFQAEMLMDLTDDIARFSDELGRKYAYVARSPKDILAVRAQMKLDGIIGTEGYAINQLPGGGQTFMNEVMHTELNSTRMFLESTADMNVYQRNLRSANSVWAATATVPMPTGLPHHLRNAQGNVFLATLGGIDNPIRFTQAARIQNLQRQIRNRIDEVGGTWDDAAKAVKGVSAEDAVLIEEIRALGITASSQAGDQVGMLGNEGGLAQAILGSWPVTKGRALGETFENNGRIALYIDGRIKGMSPERAASNTRTFLFDYSDLTKFESGAARVLMRFYTFTRKNMAVMASSLVRYPGRVVNAQRVMEAGTDAFMGSEIPTPEGMILPDWFAEKNIKLRSGGLYGAITGAEYQAAGVDTPLVAASGTLGNLGSYPGSVPGLREILPEWMTYGGKQDTYARTLGLFNGVPTSVLDLFYGGRFGRDPFTGGPLEEGGVNDALRVFETFLPIVSRVDGLIEKWMEDEGEVGRWLLYINNLTGLSNFNMTDDRQEGARAHIINQVEDAVTAFRKEYPDSKIPSISELRAAGALAFQSAALQAAWYADPDDIDSDLLASMTKEQRDGLRDDGYYIGPEPEDRPATRGELAIETQNRIDSQILFRERNGMTPLTYTEILNLRLSSPGIPNQGFFLQRDIEPLSNANRFSTKEDVDTSVEDLNNFNAVMGYGTTIEELAELQPLLDDMSRAVQEAIDDNVTEEEFDDWLINDYLTRTEKGNLPAPFGIEPGELYSVDLWRDGTLSADDLDKFKVRAWEQRAVVDFYYKRYIGRAPTWLESTTWVYQTLMSKGDQVYAGLKPGVVVPSRGNVQSEAEEKADAIKLIDIVNQTTLSDGTSGPALGGGSGSSRDASTPNPFANRSPGG